MNGDWKCIAKRGNEREKLGKKKIKLSECSNEELSPPNREKGRGPTFRWRDVTDELCLPVKNMEIEVESVPAPESSRHYWPQKRTEKAKSRREAMISRR